MEKYAVSTLACRNRTGCIGQMKKYRIYALISALICLISDQWIKSIAPKDQDIQLVPGLLNLTFVKNTGMSFGLFTDGNTPLILLTGAIFVGMILYLCLRCPDVFRQIALGLMVGGAAGNLIDRFGLGYVHDMLQFDFFTAFPVFNVADAGIVIGAVLLGISIIF